MAFGVKIRKLETRKPYSMVELFEAIRDKEFSAGKPELVKHGLTDLIVFPPIDRNNQVQIGQGVMGKGPFTRFQVTKGEIVGVGNMVKGMALSDLTDGWSRFSGVFGKKSRDAEEMVVKVAQELQALGL